MPRRLHEKLDKRARAMGLKKGTADYDRYVYGTLRKVEREKRERKRVSRYS